MLRKKKRIRKPLNYTDRCVMAGKAMLIDQRLGYNAPVSVYEQMWNINQK